MKASTGEVASMIFFLSFFFFFAIGEGLIRDRSHARIRRIFLGDGRNGRSKPCVLKNQRKNGPGNREKPDGPEKPDRKNDEKKPG